MVKVQYMSISIAVEYISAVDHELCTVGELPDRPHVDVRPQLQLSGRADDDLLSHSLRSGFFLLFIVYYKMGTLKGKHENITTVSSNERFLC